MTNHRSRDWGDVGRGQGMPAASRRRRGKKQILPWSFQKEPALLTPCCPLRLTLEF